MWKMTEIGLTTENFEEIENDTVLEVEVTPNRPDWLSIIGVAREVAAIEGKIVKEIKTAKVGLPKTKLPFSIKTDAKLAPRYTGLLISGVRVEKSPEWLVQRLKSMGARSINNLVDITNYVMFELGIPVHVFDYDKFPEKKLVMEQSLGGEKFISVDQISYILPKNTIIIKDGGEVIDLCGIKGGGNCGVDENTTNIYIHVPIYKPNLIRRASQALKLSSDASYIYERGANAGGTVKTLERIVELTLKLAGGDIASNVMDFADRKYIPWKIALSLNKLDQVLGITIPRPKIKSILSSLGIKTTLGKQTALCVIPTNRGDLNIEEDLIEEIARVYSYNKFPKTLPTTTPNPIKTPYFFDDSLHLKIKYLLAGAGYSETKTLSLLSKSMFTKSQLKPGIRLANPVSNEYEYLKTSLIPTLLLAIKLNENEKEVKLFELSKVYLGTVDKRLEIYNLGVIAFNSSYLQIKGVLELILDFLGIGNIEIVNNLSPNGLWHPGKSGQILVNKEILGEIGIIHPQVSKNFGLNEEIVAFELNVGMLEKYAKTLIFKEPGKYPAQIEDITFSFPDKTKIGEAITKIKAVDIQILDVSLVDSFKNYYTFRIWYQNENKTLINSEVKILREKVIKTLKEKFGGSEKI
jgi:phenylalanyl-tRNA synthetase beta chain